LRYGAFSEEGVDLWVRKGRHGPSLGGVHSSCGRTQAWAQSSCGRTARAAGLEACGGEVPACGHLPLAVSRSAGRRRRRGGPRPRRGYAGAAIGLTPARSWRVTRIVATVMISASSAIPETR